MVNAWDERLHPRDPANGEFVDRSGWAGRLLDRLVPGRAAEADAVARLSSGKKLDLSDPDQRHIHDLINTWSTGGHEGARLQAQMQAAVRDPGADTDGARFMRVVSAAPPNAPVLYRGMAHVDLDELPGQDAVFSLSPTSFTRSTKVMQTFSKHSSSEYGRATSVHIRLAKGSRSLQIDQEVTGEHKGEQEHVTMGRYRVTRRNERTVTVQATDGGKKEITLVELDLEQVPDDTPTTHAGYHRVIAGAGEGGS